MKLLALSIDSKILDRHSAAAQRMIEYGSFLDELHIVVHASSNEKIYPLSQNVFIYPTNCSKILYFFKALAIGGRIIKGKGIGLIVSQDALTNIVAFLLRFRFKIPVEIQIHTDFLNTNYINESFKNHFRSLLYAIAAKYSDRVRVVSRRVRTSLLKIGIHKDKIVTLPIYIDAEKIKNTTPSFNLHERYKQFDRIVLMVSRLSTEKNIPLALRSLAIALENEPRLGLVIVGDGPERAKLEALAGDLNISKNVVFEGWQTDTISYFKTADLFLSTSMYEGYGMSLVEAYVSGLPIISTDAGVAGDIGARIVSSDVKAVSAALSVPYQKTERPPHLETQVLVSKEEYFNRLRMLWQNGV